MLTIHMKNRTRPDGIACALELNDLFRTLRVVGEVPFIEPYPGLLINLQHIERIDFDTEPELTTDEARAALEDEHDLIAVVPRRPPGGSAQWREG